MIAVWNGVYAGPLVAVTRLSAWKLVASVDAPIAAATDLYQSGEMSADVPMTGIIVPPLSCLTSVRKVLACRFSVSFATSDSPALLMELMAGAMNVWDPMSLPKASAIFLYPSCCAIATIAKDSSRSGGTSRKKYGKWTESNSDWPVMQNDTILFAFMIGTTLAASSEVHPMTRARLAVVANICLVAGTASAGSPRVSTPLQLSLWPSTPPALLIAAVAPSQETR